MPVTLKQLAVHSGVSVPTISQILNEKGYRYSDETCRKVLQAVKDLGYRPNSSARAIRLGRFNCAALLLSTESYRSFLPAPLLRGMHDGLAEKDMHLSLAMLPDEKLTSLAFMPKLMRQWMADGLLINYHVHAPQGLRDLIREYKLPSVWINTPQETDAVSPDDRQGTRLLTERLVALGHRSIAYADLASSDDREPDHFSAVNRFDGYTQAIRTAGLSVRLIRPPTRLDSFERTPFAEQELLRPNRPTAVVCYGDSTALVLLQAATQMGLQVPRELSIATVSEQKVSYTGVPITTAIIPWQQVGAEASHMLMERISRPESPQCSRLIPYTEIVGDTLSAPRPAVSNWSLRRF
jgi:LacI family transcriptional regulator